MFRYSQMNSFASHLESHSPSAVKDGMIEVYAHNFLQEMKTIRNLISEYPVIGMDTEFPGTVYSCETYSTSFYYDNLKLNVDNWKLIQLGITLSKPNGERPEKVHTWQMNFKFDTKKNKYNEASWDLLLSSGIDFGKLRKQGINHKYFAEYLMTSGLVLNPDITWISFHGSYDFAYIWKDLIGQPLPDTEDEFTEWIELYFPNHYDIKFIALNQRHLQGGLNRLANYLNITRKGKVHQAGSDSLVTLDVYFALLNSKYIEEEELSGSRNVLYGLGFGADDEKTIAYTQFAGCGYPFNTHEWGWKEGERTGFSNVNEHKSKSRSTSGNSSLDVIQG